MKKDEFYTVCQSIRGVMIIRMKTDEIYTAAKWYSQTFTRVRCKPVKFVWTINSFRCYLQGCKFHYFFSGPLHFTMYLVRNELMEENITLMFSDEKCIVTLLLPY